MVGFIIAGGQAAADTFSVSLKLCKPWVSIGAVETLIYPRRLNRVKVSRRVYALSVGLENIEDIIADLDQALNKASKRAGEERNE